jgi:RNA polymerase sigma-70 factor (ECF subfamily)
MVALLPRLRRFALSLTGARDRADDLVQSTCERALRSTGQWVPGTKLDSWMFRIMRNLFIDGVRRAKGEGRPEPVEEALDAVGEDGERSAEARLTLSAVEKAIGALPEDYRSVLVFVCIEEFSYKEAAAVLDVPIGTVMSRLSRARQNLSDAVGMSAASPGTRRLDA